MINIWLFQTGRHYAVHRFTSKVAVEASRGYTRLCIYIYILSKNVCCVSDISVTTFLSEWSLYRSALIRRSYVLYIISLLPVYPLGRTMLSWWWTPRPKMTSVLSHTPLYFFFPS